MTLIEEQLEAVAVGMYLALVTVVSKEYADQVADSIGIHVGLGPHLTEPAAGYSARRMLNDWRIPTP